MDPKRNIFLKCMPCLGAPPVDEDPEEYIKNTFGSQYTEYEYVIENLAVTPVPKALLDEISANPTGKKKKQIKIVNNKNRVITGQEEIFDNESISINNVQSNKESCDGLPDDTHLSNKPEDRVKKNKIFGAGGSQDIRYNPCYVHLCADKDACTECKQGPDNKRDILRRMLLPPGAINPQANPLNPQVNN